MSNVTQTGLGTKPWPEKPSGGFSRSRKPTRFSRIRRRDQFTTPASTTLLKKKTKSVISSSSSDKAKLFTEFTDFMQEMLSMMNNVKDEANSFEDLQKMFADMVGGGDGLGFDFSGMDPTSSKKPRVGASNTGKRSASRR
ncbi:Chaperone DnaJ-domain superfamily protein [Prunus dulcis]|uniref:Chaperone DnaJ-domain superfamily protein n=1 Tax=Prunus dulcis TaxID=3755 RepID=A0A4Y1RQ62_PRUDU|nr:Chaperone DnaJ-domain superfamily protein [Prunus dulcis]